MSKGLKGITVEIDGNTTPLNKALSSVNANAKSLQSELKGVNSLLKLDPKNTELAAQKQVILKQAVSETEEKLKLLTQAEKEMAEAGKDVNDEGYRDLQREIALTKSKLSDYKTELKAVEDQQKKAAKEAETLGTKIYNIASKIPVVNKLADGFVKVKGKITETVKESEAVKKIGTTVEGAKQKVEAFKDAHPAVQKVADAFGKVKTAANEVKEKIPPLSTQLGLKGAIKKLGYWAVILVAFIISNVFTQLGTDVLHVNLSFLLLIGWFTLAMLLVNEARSILENLVECGYNIPDFLIKGLAVTQKMLNNKAEIPDANDEEK